MDGRPLPGFFYDAEKRKYFRIQETKDAVPDAEYSQDSVKLKKRRGKRTRADSKRKATQEVQQVQRAPILAPDSLPGSILTRELGHCLAPGFRIQNQAKLYSSLLSLTYAPASDGVPLAVAYNADEDIVFSYRANLYDGVVRFQPASNYPYSRDEDVGHIVITFPIDPPGCVACLSISPNGAMLCSSPGDDDHDPFVFLLERPLSRQPMNILNRRASGGQPTCSAANPYEADPRSTAAFAVGAGDLVFLMPGSVQFGSVGFYDFECSVTSIDWLDARTLAVGCRNGRVFLWDTRARTPSSISARLRCRGAITKLRTIKKNYIAICQPPYMPALFDLRTASTTNSKPIIKYYSTFQRDSDLGFDVHAELGVAAQADAEGCVLMHNLWTGELLRRISIADHGLIPYLMFIDTPRGVELLGAHSGTDFKLHL